MLQVFTVDKITRIQLPESQWGIDVRERLKELGHEVEFSGPLTGSLNRDSEEINRVMALLEEAGIP